MERNTEQEAQALAARFKNLNRAQFARENQVPGGQAMIYQNINGLKPISLEGAIAYVRGFGCTLAEISPFWARRLAEVPLFASQERPAYGNNVESLDARRAGLSDLQKALIEITRDISEIGLAMLIGRAQEIAIHHPAVTVKKPGKLISFPDGFARSSLRGGLNKNNIS